MTPEPSARHKCRNRGKLLCGIKRRTTETTFHSKGALIMNSLTRPLAMLATVTALTLPAAAQDQALALVPADAVTVGVVHLADMRSSLLSSLLFQHVDRLSTDGEAERFLLDAGLRPQDDVDVLVVATSPRTSLGSEPNILVIAEGDFQPQRLAAALLARGAVRKGAYITFPDEEGNGGEAGAVAFLSPQLAIAGNERAVVNALAARASGGTGFVNRGALAMDLGRIDRGATAWAIIDVPRAARLANVGTIDTGRGQTGAVLQAGLKSVSTVILWAKDTGDALRLGATSLSNDPETLALLEDAVRGALAALRIAASEEAPEMVSVLRRFDIERSSRSMTVEGSIPAAELRDLLAKRMATK